LLAVLILEILGRTNVGWPFYAAMTVWLLVALPIRELQRRPRKPRLAAFGHKLTHYPALDKRIAFAVVSARADIV